MNNYKNILFINYGGIGDEILFLPAIKSVVEQYKDAKITLALEPRAKSISSLAGYIDEIITVDIKEKGFKKYINLLKFIFEARKKRFDCVVSSGKNLFIGIILSLLGIKERVGYNSKTGFLLTKKIPLIENQYAARMYHDLVKPIVEVEYKNPQIEIIGEFYLDKSLEKEGFICIHPGVSKMSIQKNIFKCPKTPFWINVVQGLLEKEKKVVLLGANDDETLINEILKNEKIKNNSNFYNYYKKTKSLAEMAFVMKNASCVICADSAPLHIATALGVKTLAIFGPTNEKKLTPDNSSNIELITAQIGCRPCLWDKRICNCEESKCLDIDPELILSKIN